MRTGIIAKKVGMSRVFTDKGADVPVTVLQVENLQVTQQKNEDKNGYNALQLGMANQKPSRVSKPLQGHFAKAKVEPKKHVAEFHVDTDNMLDVGTQIKPDLFEAGQYVDVQGQTIGKGFAGAMKRHNFKGLEMTHGISTAHRAVGSTGHCQDPGKVFKGKKMPGHYGSATRSQQNLEIIRVDVDRGLLLVKGSVPGAKGSVVRVKDALKKQKTA